MDELLKVNYSSDRITLSARELYEFLEVRERFSRWYERMVSYGFSEDIDYRCVRVRTGVPNNGGTQIIDLQDYEITLDMAKEIAMVQRSEKGKIARRYFIEIEKRWNSPEYIMNRALEISRNRVKALENEIEKNKYKVDFFNAVTESKNAIQMSEVAKLLNFKGYGRNRLFEFLINQGVLMSNNQPYQKFIDRGYFRVVEQKYTKPNGDISINIKTLVYQRGIDYIRKLLTNA